MPVAIDRPESLLRVGQGVHFMASEDLDQAGLSSGWVMAITKLFKQGKGYHRLPFTTIIKDLSNETARCQLGLSSMRISLGKRP